MAGKGSHGGRGGGTEGKREIQVWPFLSIWYQCRTLIDAQEIITQPLRLCSSFTVALVWCGESNSRRASKEASTRVPPSPLGAPNDPHQIAETLISIPILTRFLA